MQAKARLGDKTLAICDICSEINPPSNGGVLLLDKDKTYTIECQDCWETFTKPPHEQRKIKNKYTLQAAIQEIGTDPISHEQLDLSKSFCYNVLSLRIKEKQKMLHYHSLLSIDPKIEFIPKPTNNDVVVVKCAQCDTVISKSLVHYCGNCRMCSYCGKECQRKDWPRHKTSCNEFVKVRSETN